MSDTPGPEVEVMERAPAHPAPKTIPMEAISSSACTTANVALPVSLSMRKRFRYSINVSTSDELGVIGYQATTVTPAIRQPNAAAELPSMMTIPAVLFIRSTFNVGSGAKVCAAKSYPALQAPQLRS